MRGLIPMRLKRFIGEGYLFIGDVHYYLSKGYHWDSALKLARNTVH